MEPDPVDVVRRGYDAVSHRYRGDDDAPAEYVAWTDELGKDMPPGGRLLLTAGHAFFSAHRPG